MMNLVLGEDESEAEETWREEQAARARVLEVAKQGAPRVSANQWGLLPAKTRAQAEWAEAESARLGRAAKPKPKAAN